MIITLPKEISPRDVIYQPILLRMEGDKFVLELNSHSLSNFQLCERKFSLSEIETLTPKGDYYPFKRGSGISRYLSIWYLAKKRGYSDARMSKLEFQLFKKMARSKAFINSATGKKDNYLIAGRLSEYFSKYRNEKLGIISVEEGFSKVIYEDSSNLFIYSGRPDLVVDFGPNFGIGFMDHKSEARAYDIAPYNNQFLGYAWALNSLNGMINYIGLQSESNQGSVLRRQAIGYSLNEVNRWAADTIEWFKRIADSIKSGKYLRSWRCDTKYGMCQFYPICTSGSQNEEVMKMERDFIRLGNPYRSW